MLYKMVMCLGERLPVVKSIISKLIYRMCACEPEDWKKDFCETYQHLFILLQLHSASIVLYIRFGRVTVIS